MSALNSRFLFIGEWPSALIEKWGGLHLVNLSGSEASRLTFLDVVISDMTNIENSDFKKLYTDWKKKNPYIQLIGVLDQNLSLKTIHQFHQKFHFKKILNHREDPQLESFLLQSLSMSQELNQIEQLSFLQNEQSEKLEALQNELENRVEKRAKFLSETRRKLFVSHERMEAFQRLLVQLPSAQSLEDLEKLLNENLSRVLSIQWIRILFQPDDEKFLIDVREKFDYEVHRLFLYDQNEKKGSLFLMGSEAKIFTKEETEFLQQVTESVSLRIEALLELDQLKLIKKQWQKTFQALSDPLLLIDQNYQVLQSNRSQDGEPTTCHRLLFNQDSPCVGCQLGQVFQVQQNKHTWEVRGQTIEVGKVYAHFYRDVTNEIEMQKRRLETSRFVELGTISSSLAHELNNPLAGLLTFAQMLRMDLKEEDPIRSDILEIEKAVLKCRDIIQNLLLYARDPSLDPVQSLDLVDLMQKFVKILEIPSRSKGLKVKALLSDKPIFFETRQTWLLSVWKSLGLLALQVVEDSRKKDPTVRNEIIVSLSESASVLQWNLEVDTDLTVESESDPVLNSFEKILTELECELSFERVHGRGTRAKITFRRDSRPARKP